MESNPTTWLPSQMCLICTSSSAPLKPPIPISVVDISSGNKIDTSGIKCESIPNEFPEWDTSENNPEGCDNTTNSDNVIDHVKAVFVLRKLLNYPKTGCAKYLRLYGVNPGNWFTLCFPCNVKVGECYRLYRQLRQLEHRWVELKKELKNEIFNGKDKFVDKNQRTKIKHVWQDVRDFVSGKQMYTSPQNSKQPCIPEQLTVAVEPDMIFGSLGGYSNDNDTIPDPLEDDEEEDAGSDWEPEHIPEGAEADLDGVSSDDRSDSNIEVVMYEELSAYEEEISPQSEKSPRKTKRKASESINSFKKKTRKIKVEPNSTVLRDPVINPHIPLPPESHHSYKCTLCVGFYYQRVKFDKHLSLHKIQGGIPCEFCGWYHKSEYMRFHVNHFHNPDNPRVVKEGKRKYKPKKRKVKVEGEETESIIKDNANETQSTQTNLQVKGGPGKKKKKKGVRKTYKEEFVYYCDHCEMKCLHQRQMILHFEAFHTGKEKPSCTICNEDFLSKQFLQLHADLAHPTKLPPMEEKKEVEQCEPPSLVHKCIHCDEVFSSTIKLDYHILKSHKSVKWTCHCGLQTGQYSVFKAHMLTHTGEKPFACHLCDKVYRANLNLKNHMRQVHFKELGIDPLKCPICEISCLTNQAFKVHMEVTHGSEKTHCCEICGKMSGTKHNLKKHMITHENDNTKSHYSYAGGRYSCTFCDASYTQNRNIVKHLRKMHPERCEFKCAGCDTQYCSIQGLRKHQALCESYQKTLPEQAKFKCRVCDEVFTVKNQLLDHRKKMHSKYECDACGLKVNSENMIVRHKSKCLGVKLSKHAEKKAKKLAKLAAANNQTKVGVF